MIISIVNHKGGTGKTTTVVNLGVALGQLGKKVLLIDLDPQGNLSYSMDISSDIIGVSEVFTGEKNIQDCIINKEGIDIIPSNMFLADIELSLQSAEDRTNVLKKMLEPIATTYDYVLIDCPPSRSLLIINALVVSDAAISTVLLDVLSIQGLNHIYKTIAEVKSAFNSKLRFIGIVAVNADIRKKIAKEVIDFIKDNFEIPIFKTYIRSNVKITEAPSHGESVLGYAPTSNGAKDYLALAKELINLKA
jgi:chromosome partitioning protein